MKHNNNFNEIDDDDESQDEFEMKSLLSNRGHSNTEKRTQQFPLKVVCIAFLVLAASVLFFVSVERKVERNDRDNRNSLRESAMEYSFDNAQSFGDWGRGYYDIDTTISEARQISILGERNSGVAWLKKKMSTCFPDLEITTSLTRPAHLFQSEELHDESRPTVVISLTLNPYDWIEIMRTHPRYMPDHMNMGWEKFVTTSWSTRRPIRDVEYLKGHAKHDRDCQFQFSYEEIVPCLGDDAADSNMSLSLRPLYELNVNSGDAYETILDFRSAKLRNHRRVKNWKNVTYFHVHYEQFNEIDGFEDFILMIQTRTGFDIECNLTDHSFIAPVLRQRNLDRNYVDWLNTNLKWKTEHTVGYDQREFNELNDRL